MMKSVLILLAAILSFTVYAEPFFIKKWYFGERNAKAWNGASIQEKAMMLNGTGLAFQAFSIPDHADGRRFVFRAVIQGQGMVRPGVILIKLDGKRKILQENEIGFADHKKTLEFILDLSREGDISRVAPSLRFNGRFKVFSAEFKEVPESGSIKPEAVTPFQIHRQGEKLPDVVFRGDAQKMTILQIINGRTVSVDAGKNSVPGRKADHVLYRAASGGKYTDVSQCIFPQKEYDRFAAAASRIKIEKPVSILYLGDSLTDFARGYNHVDMTAFWLQKYNPGKITVTNAAVHGDFIERVYHRLIHRRGTFKQYRYDDLWKKEYDMILIWLGHNDTVWRKSIFPAGPQPRTSPEQQKILFRKVFQEIRKHSQARIVLITASPMNAERCRDNTEKYKLKIQFAIPELVENWNEQLKKIAAENNMYCIDIYPGLKQDPQFQRLTSDGIHFTHYGHRGAAYILLKEFQNFFK